MNNNTIMFKNKPLQRFCAGAEFSSFDEFLADLLVFTTEMAVKIKIKNRNRSFMCVICPIENCNFRINLKFVVAHSLCVITKANSIHECLAVPNNLEGRVQ